MTAVSGKLRSGQIRAHFLELAIYHSRGRRKRGVRSGGSAEIAKFERKDRADPPMIPPTLMMSAKSPNYPNPKLQRNMSMAHNVAVTFAVHRSADGALWNWGRSRRAVRWTYSVGGRCPVLSTGKCGRQAGRRVVGNNIAYL